MDAQLMDLPDTSFDAALSRFGFMLMPEPARAMAETHRVLKSGGRLAFAVWGPPERNPWIGVIGLTLTQLGLAPPGDPFAPGGIFSLSPPAATRDLTAQAGFTRIRVEEIPVVQRFETFDEYWDFQTEIAGPLAMLIRSLSGEDAGRARSAVEEAAASFQTSGGYEFPGVAIGTAAVK